ncbi:MAG: hypothetical protein LBU50_02675 [Cellulomonas sp.]|jgi:hypothetical protein|nr:hypothetical protein [Cellulomonas sp.]
MAQSSDHSDSCVTSAASSGEADEVTDTPEPAVVVEDDLLKPAQPVRTDEPARPPSTSVDLATVARVVAQLAEITQSLDALTASAAAIRADVELTSEALTQLTAGVLPSPRADETPVDLVAQAAQQQDYRSPRRRSRRGTARRGPRRTARRAPPTRNTELPRLARIVFSCLTTGQTLRHRHCGRGLTQESQ